jgi:hypothetical protein
MVSVMMGSLILDLRETNLTEHPARIELRSIMSGVVILVPEAWKVDIDVRPLVARVWDERTRAIELEDRPTDLVLTGHVFMSRLDVATQMPVAASSTGASLCSNWHFERLS